MSERMAIVLYENKNGKKGTDETESLLGLERNIYIYYWKLLYLICHYVYRIGLLFIICVI